MKNALRIALAAACALAATTPVVLAQTTIAPYASKLCADEGHVCYVRQYPAVVIFATPAAQVAKVVTGPTPCTPAYWSDPQRGVVKSCYAIVGLFDIPPGVPVAPPPASAPASAPAASTPSAPASSASSPSDSASSPSNPASTPTTTTPTDPAAAPITWAQVAVEGASFTVPGGYTRTVRYGNPAHNLWSLKNVKGSGTCSTAFFGDDPVNPAAVWGAPKSCQIASALTPIPPVLTTTTMLGMSGAPLINLSLIPPDGTATSGFNVKATTEKPGKGGGEFRTLCTFSHMTFDDPIVFPGAAGAAHLHSFFGNSLTSSTSTPESLRTTGKSTCRGGIANRSAYWVPTMIDTRDGTPLVPKFFEPYYKNSVYGNDVHHLPVGLRMIAGDHTASAPQSGPVNYKCIGGPNNENDKYGPSIPNCDLGAEMWMQVFFPTCWDGVNLDSPNHKSHMAGTITVAGRFECPADHPVALPAITFNVVYGVYEKDAPTHWRLSSDKYGSDKPGGYSAHGDWFNGWDATVSDSWVDNCIRAVVDCHGDLTGDGRTMY